MTFEGFDAAPLIEGAGFSPLMAGGVLVADADGTLEAALRAPGPGLRATLDAPDLWVPRSGGHGADIFGHRETSWRGWLGQGSPDHGPFQGTKDVVLRAAFDDVDGDGEEDGPITVTGTRNVNEGTGDSNGGGYGGGFYPGATGYEGDLGGGGSIGPTQNTADAKDTPCVDEVPAGLTRDQVNDLAKGIAGTLGSLQDNTNWEWGAVIYRAADGELYQSIPFTARHHDDMNGATVSVPNGSVIVGYIHTHPIDSTMDQRTLSDVDRDFISILLARTGNVTADSNMLAYVTTKDKDLGNSDTYSTFVYDKSRRTASTPGCDL